MKDLNNIEAQIDVAFDKTNWILVKNMHVWTVGADWNSKTQEFRFYAEKDTLDQALDALLEYAETLEVS